MKNSIISRLRKPALFLPLVAFSMAGLFAAPAMADEAYCFPANVWVVDFYAAQGFQLPNVAGTDSHEDMSQLSGGVAWYFVPDVSLGWVLTGSYTSQDGGSVESGGGNLQFRVHFLDETNWTIFWDLEMGLLESSRALPPRGTDFNYTVHTGFGASIRLDDRIDLIAGGRFLHVSNADVQGEHRNPSINGGEGYAGLMFRL